MGKLADAISASDERRGGVGCTLGKVIASMSEEDRTDLLFYLRDMEVSASRIANVLNGMKYDVNVFSVRKHRNRILRRDGLSCRCPLPKEDDDE